MTVKLCVALLALVALVAWESFRETGRVHADSGPGKIYEFYPAPLHGGSGSDEPWVLDLGPVPAGRTFILEGLDLSGQVQAAQFIPGYDAPFELRIYVDGKLRALLPAREFSNTEVRRVFRDLTVRAAGGQHIRIHLLVDDPVDMENEAGVMVTGTLE